MKKLNDSILSGASRKIDKIRVVIINGTQYLLIAPAKQNIPPEIKKELLELRLIKADLFIESYKNYASKHYNNNRQIISPYYQAMSNLINNFKINYNTLTINIQYPKIAFSKGDLLTPFGFSLIKTSSCTIEINWINNAYNNPSRNQDLLQILIAPHQEIKTYFFKDVATRSQETFSLTIPNRLLYSPIHFYVAFKSSDDASASNSLYIGIIS